MKHLFFKLFLVSICMLIFFSGTTKAQGLTEEVSALNDHVDKLTEEIRGYRNETANLDNFKKDFIADMAQALNTNFTNIIIFFALSIFIGGGILRYYMKKQYELQLKMLTEMLLAQGISQESIFKARKRNLEKSGATKQEGKPTKWHGVKKHKRTETKKE